MSDNYERLPPGQRPSARQLAAQSEQPMQIAGKPADVCPRCGAAMFIDKVNRTNHEIVRYVECRNARCGRRFVSYQQPAKLLREIGGEDDNSAGGKHALTVVRESA